MTWGSGDLQTQQPTTLWADRGQGEGRGHGPSEGFLTNGRYLEGMQMICKWLWLHIKTRFLGRSPDRDLEMAVLSLNTFWNDLSTGQPLPSHLASSHKLPVPPTVVPRRSGKGAGGEGSCHSHSPPVPAPSAT